MSEQQIAGKKQVRRQFYRRGKPIGDGMSDEEHIMVDVFETQPGSVTSKVGMTVNLGDFESLRIDVGVTLPCYKEEIEDALAKSFEIAEADLYRRVTEVKENL